MSLSDRPLFTQEFDTFLDFTPEDGAAYIYGITSEPRSEFALDLMRRHPSVRFVEVRETDSLTFETDVEGFEHVFTRRRSTVEKFAHALGDGPIYLDMTGLSHNTWAPLVRVFLELNKTLRVIYLEPTTYNVVTGPDSGEIFDLSERVEGISPIPLFATLSETPETEICFIALLGFEGVRFLHMVSEMQPDPTKIFPVIGVPGFRLHYPFDAYVGNAMPIEKYKAWRNIGFARSNCPFSLFYELEDLSQKFPNDQIRIGLIGTKPHALGAILFAISRPEKVEIVYDHVKRKSGRTRGVARCLIYGISEFLPPDRRSPV